MRDPGQPQRSAATIDASLQRTGSGRAEVNRAQRQPAHPRDHERVRVARSCRRGAGALQHWLHLQVGRLQVLSAVGLMCVCICVVVCLYCVCGVCWRLQAEAQECHRPLHGCCSKRTLVLIKPQLQQQVCGPGYPRLPSSPLIAQPVVAHRQLAASHLRGLHSAPNHTPNSNPLPPHLPSSRSKRSQS